MLTEVGALTRFADAYASHRAREGRHYSDEDLFELPYLRCGPFAGQWSVRARSFDAFMQKVLRPMAKDRQRPVTVLDLGAGNGWLSYRVASESHNAIAIDIREDRVDGLGAGEVFEKALPNRIRRLTASFDRLPVEVGCADLAVFNASIHYATDLFAALSEAARATRPGGRIVILDTPFYQREEHGLAMVAEKRQSADQVFGELAADLLSLPFIEFLTRERLAEASAPLGLHWRRQRVLYPIGYELRGLRARLGGQRPPSRFDLWHCLRP